MSVSSITSSSAAVGLKQTDWRSTVKQGRQDFSQLLGALQSGDVSGAQQAYAAMQQLLPGFQEATQASSGTANTVGTDFSALGAALNSGSLAGAQDAVAKLQQDAQAYRQEHHKFGDLAHAREVYNSMQQDSAAGTTAAGSLKDDLAALGQALQAGSMSSAQDAFAKLQQDLQSTQPGHHRHHGAAGGQNPLSSYLANSLLGSAASGSSSTGSAVKVAV